MLSRIVPLRVGVIMPPAGLSAAALPRPGLLSPVSAPTLIAPTLTLTSVLPAPQAAVAAPASARAFAAASVRALTRETQPFVAAAAFYLFASRRLAAAAARNPR